MKDKKITTKVFRPDFENDLDIIALSGEKIADETMFSYGTILDCSLENQEAERITFKQVIFKKVIFNQTTFRRIELMNVRFENCDLSNADYEFHKS